MLIKTQADAKRLMKTFELVVQAQRVEAEYITGELQAAQRIQTGILPRAESLRDEHRIDLAATMIPAREVGGDLYDFFLLDADRLFFLIGDVAGKGLSASIFMAISKALYKSTTLRQPEARVSDLMRAANDEVSRDNPEMFFVTVFAGVIDLDSGELAAQIAVDAVLADARSFVGTAEPADDVTVVALRWLGPEEANVR